MLDCEQLKCFGVQHSSDAPLCSSWLKQSITDSKADLVPVYTFGENDIYRLIQFPEGSFVRRLQLGFKQLTGLAPSLFSGRGLFSSTSWGIQPMAAPLTVVVGKPIPVPLRPRPTEDEVNSFHALYVEALKELFDAHKESCGLPASQQLLIT
ncbi:2-acylglycerol O-acyltransferase 3 [Podarcis lilfordi]|uniref:2-acylglycerol O-acyltransferase 3 n=1 Tax=Podarcis lilfordi TaxID=74358 RepID=A0AA35PJU9_9SAUR|nr:2-acylglycerol O-acyltransferase 3 [Podarcis lilfordi]